MLFRSRVKQQQTYVQIRKSIVEKDIFTNELAIIPGEGESADDVAVILISLSLIQTGNEFQNSKLIISTLSYELNPP